MTKKSLILMLVSLLSLAAMAADLSGNWTGTFHTREGGAFETNLTLKQSGDTVTGQFQSGNNDPIDIENGKVNGDTVTWIITRGTGDKTRKINYTGKVEGNTMHLTFQAEGATRSNQIDLTKK